MANEFSSENRVGFGDGSFARACKTCKVIRDISDYPMIKRANKKILPGAHCKRCWSNITIEQSKISRAKHLDKRKAGDRKNYWKTRDKSLARSKQWRFDHKEEQKIYFQQRYEEIKDTAEFKEKQKVWGKKKRQDPVKKLKGNISGTINLALKANGSSKAGKSFTKYIGYTMNDLKEHLEKQFEPWMNWENRGTYKTNDWDDNDPTTWKWQIDHIKPHSDFQYTSMEEQSFRDCWRLDNLRPYSAKQNLLDGTTRTRHLKKKGE